MGTAAANEFRFAVLKSQCEKRLQRNLLQKGREKGLSQGEAKGKAEGKAEGMLEVARAMKAEGMETSLIVKLTGLDADKINAL